MTGVALALGGAIVGWLLFTSVDPAPFRPASDYSVLAGLFVMAAAVERLLEPFAVYVGPKTTQTRSALENAVATAVTAPEAENLKAAANMQATLNRKRFERGFILWGAATLVATLLCAGFGLLMLRAVSAEPAKDPNRFMDLLVTGLVVGAGTKPLHDLVTRMQKAKEEATDPPETAS
ncbi:MAG TPA: hypothetical protein VNB24_09115 [Acidimicrobiales bacterium]|nr:hypothetical protein [Acidimicrobiales bacterium]